MKWLQLEKRTPEDIIETVCDKHYMVMLPYKPKHWVTCYQPKTLEDALGLMKAYMSAEASIYIQKNLQKQDAQAEQGKTLR